MSNEKQKGDAPEITPQVLHLRDLLKWVRHGRIRVPEFQRDFTWDRHRMLTLFDSIRRQYPIGTLLFWETSLPFETQDQIGPLIIPSEPAASSSYLVLDGQQRLATLAGVLLYDELPRNNRVDADERRWEMWFDADGDRFVYVDQPSSAPLSAVRVSSLMGTRGVYEAARRILTDESISKDKRDAWVSRIEGVSEALGAYRLPLVVFFTNSLDLAVECFARLNRGGVKVGPDELISALTYRAGSDGEQGTFRLAKEIDLILAEAKQMAFGPIERIDVLRLVLLAIDLDPFRTEWQELADATKREKEKLLPGALKRARDGLLAAIGFLREEGIHNSRLLPYAIQLVGLAAFFGNLNGAPTEAQRRLIRRWLWVTAFTEAFGGLNPSRQLRQLKSLTSDVPAQDFPSTIDGVDLDEPAHPFPSRHDSRSARVRTLICVMLENGVRDRENVQQGSQKLGDDLLARGPAVLRQVFTRGPVNLLSSPANRVYDLDRTRRSPINWLREIGVSLSGSQSKEVLSSMHISPEAYQALIEDNIQTFIDERQKTLIALEVEFMRRKGVTVPADFKPMPTAIDIEDDEFLGTSN